MSNEIGAIKISNELWFIQLRAEFSQMIAVFVNDNGLTASVIGTALKYMYLFWLMRITFALFMIQLIRVRKTNRTIKIYMGNETILLGSKSRVFVFKTYQGINNKTVQLPPC